MATLDWTWRQTGNLPDKALVVVSRTQYTDKTWSTFKDLLVPSFYRLLGDPNVLGIAVRTEERAQVSWGMSAWSSYEALEACAREQFEWLAKAAQELETETLIRHNGVRVCKTTDLPMSWSSAEQMLRSVMKASPLGADVIPGVSKLLGINGGASA